MCGVPRPVVWAHFRHGWWSSCVDGWWWLCGGGCRVLMGDGGGCVLIGGGGGCVLTWSCHCVTVLLVVARVTCQLLKLFRLHAIYNAV